VTIVEVSPRDGLQSDPAMLSTVQKVELITRAVQAGLRRIETVSFVNPKRVPQMADADEVMEALLADDETRRSGARYIGLVLNRRGLDRAIATGVDEINVVVIASDTFAERNQGAPTEALLDAAAEICAEARTAGLFSSVTIGASFGCPFEGEVALGRLEWVLERVAQCGADEVALADSIGVAVPSDVRTRFALAADVLVDPDRSQSPALRGHFHNTRNTGLANALAAVEAGVATLDSSLGGIGGCPFAPNATGNIPTEDLAYLLDRSGVALGLDVDRLLAIPGWLQEVLGHSVPGYVSKAGWFPSRPTP
jgi:hydroxymethylglutaryl-CoA lyase